MKRQNAPAPSSLHPHRLLNLNQCQMVGTEGLEPSRIAPQVPKTCASADSATSPPGHCSNDRCRMQTNNASMASSQLDGECNSRCRSPGHDASRRRKGGIRPALPPRRPPGRFHAPAHPRIIARTSSRRRSISSRVVASRFRRMSGSVFEARTFMCHVGYVTEMPSIHSITPSA